MNRRRRAATVALLGAVVGGSLLLASRTPNAVPRCGEGLVERGPRCCGIGQRLDDGACVGVPSDCGSILVRTESGCVPPTRVIALRGGAVELAPLDWEAAGAVVARRVEVGPFRLDAFEVTYGRWAGCARAGACSPAADVEPGVPVSSVTAEEARRFCLFAGGDLPTPDQWFVAAAGSPQARRYPWGETGAVCRRVVYGLAVGPCAEGAAGPDLAGARPSGATPDGLFDLAGNVAEWTRRSDGTVEVRGGSYQDGAAAALRTWSARAEQPDARSAAIGFRCAYAP